MKSMFNKKKKETQNKKPETNTSRTFITATCLDGRHTSFRVDDIVRFFDGSDNFTKRDCCIIVLKSTQKSIAVRELRDEIYERILEAEARDLEFRK